MINFVKRITIFLLILLTVGCANQNIVEKQQPRVVTYTLIDSVWNLEQVKFEIRENNQRFSYENIEYHGSDDFEYNFINVAFYFLPRGTYTEETFFDNYNENKEIVFSHAESASFPMKLANESLGPASIEGDELINPQNMDIDTVYMEISFRMLNGEYKTSLFSIPGDDLLGVGESID